MIPLALLVVFIGFSACDTADDESSSGNDNSGDDDSDDDFGQWDEDDDNDDSSVDDDNQGDDDSGTEDDDDDNVTDCQFTEGFEMPVFPPSGWTVIDMNSYYEFNWTHTDYIRYAGNYASLIYGYATPFVPDSDELLYTSMIDLSDYSKTEITFWNFAGYAGVIGSLNPPALTLEVSHDEQNWTQIWSYPLADWDDILDYYYNMGAMYHSYTIDLDAFSGEQIWLGWRFKYTSFGDYSIYVWNLDDIEVCGTTDK